MQAISRQWHFQYLNIYSSLASSSTTICISKCSIDSTEVSTATALPSRTTKELSTLQTSRQPHTETIEDVTILPRKPFTPSITTENVSMLRATMQCNHLQI